MMIIYLFLKGIKEREREISKKTYPARRSPKTKHTTANRRTSLLSIISLILLRMRNLKGVNSYLIH